MFTEKEKVLLKNLVADKILISERQIKRFNKDYKFYKDRMNWIPGQTLGSEDSNLVKEIKRQISIEQNKINEYNNLIAKIMEA